MSTPTTSNKNKNNAAELDERDKEITRISVKHHYKVCLARDMLEELTSLDHKHPLIQAALRALYASDCDEDSAFDTFKEIALTWKLQEKNKKLKADDDEGFTQTILANNGKLSKITNNLASANETLADTNANLASTNETLTDTNAKLSAKNKSLTTTIAKLVRSNENLVRSNKLLQDQLDKCQSG